MQNLLIQQYLKDEKIPFQNRKNMAVDLDTKKIDEQTALKVLNAKYPGRYAVAIEPIAYNQETQPIVAKSQQPMVSKNVQSDISNIIPTASAAAPSKAQQVMQNIMKPEGVLSGEMSYPIQKEVKTIDPNLERFLQMMGANKEQYETLPEETKRKIQQANPFGKPADVVETAKNIGSTLMGLPGAIYQHTLEPALKWGATAEKGAEALYSVAFGKARELINEGKTDEAYKVLSDIVATPVNLYGTELNVGANAVNPETGLIDTEKLGNVYTGLNLETGSGILNTLSFGNQAVALNIPYNIVTGAMGTAGEDISKGITDPVTVAIDSVIGGGTQGAITLAFKMFNKAANKGKIDKSNVDLYKKKVDEAIRNEINLNPENKQIAYDYLDDITARLKDPKAQSAWVRPASEVDYFLNQMDDVGKVVNTKLGAAKEGLVGLKVNPAPVKDQMDDFVKSIHGYFRRWRKVTIINFDGSDLGKAPQNVKTQLNEIYKKAQQKSVDARSLESVTSQLDDALGTGTMAVYKNNKVNGINSKLKSTINGIIGEANPEFAQINQASAVYYDTVKTIRDAMKVKVGNKYESSPTNLLKRLLNMDDTKSQAVIKKITDASNFFNDPNVMSFFGFKSPIVTPTKLIDKAILAQWVENISSTEPMRSSTAVLAEGAVKGAERLGGKGTRGAIEIAKGVGQSLGLGDKNAIQTYVTSLKDILMKSLKTTGPQPTMQILKSDVLGLLATLANLERVAQNPLTTPTLSNLTENTYGNTTPADFKYEEPYITEEWQGGD